MDVLLSDEFKSRVEDELAELADKRRNENDKRVKMTCQSCARYALRIKRLNHSCRVTVVCAARLEVLERALRVGEACVVRLVPSDGLDRRAAVTPRRCLRGRDLC